MLEVGVLLKGRIKWFNNAKGYGFLEYEDSGQDVFIHYSVIEGDGYKTLIRGEEVEFELEDGERGPLAKRVLRGENPEATVDESLIRSSESGQEGSQEESKMESGAEESQKESQKESQEGSSEESG